MHRALRRKGNRICRKRIERRTFGSSGPEARGPLLGPFAAPLAQERLQRATDVLVQSP